MNVHMHVKKVMLANKGVVGFFRKEEREEWKVVPRM
jgi:hypothetical protein